MKDFDISIKNNLLEPKHVKKMDAAVWLYMWLLDKVTSTNEEKVGLIWGGKPVRYEEDIKPELGISADTYTRWIDKLLDYPYIDITRTPRGIVFRVYKTHKFYKKVIPQVSGSRFRNTSEADSADVRNAIKTIHLDNTLDKERDPLKELTEKVAMQESQKIDHEYIVKIAKEHGFTVVETADELYAFIQYWTEANAKGKQRWQQEKFFDVNRRLATWLRHKHQYRKDMKCRLGVWHKRGDQCQCERMQRQNEESKKFELTTTPQDRERINARLAELRRTLAAKMDVTKKQSVPAG